jgi:hypothetical protein
VDVYVITLCVKTWFVCKLVDWLFSIINIEEGLLGSILGLGTDFSDKIVMDHFGYKPGCYVKTFTKV